MKFRRSPIANTAEEFVAAATNQVVVPTEEEESAENKQMPVAGLPQKMKEQSSYPWEGKRTDKQTELFNLRMTEVELEKLRFISTHTPDSMQAFVRKALLPAVEAKIEDLIGKI